MDKRKAIKDWQRMYDSVTDPDIIEENKRKNEIKKRSQEKREDVGL
jgi:hypothetical protein